MRKLLIALFIVVGLLTSMSTVRAAEEESPYPTITLIFSDGGVYNISGKFWAGTIIPYIQGRINGYNWETDARSKYIFFDKALKGLNPYGIDFIRALEKYTVNEFEKEPFLILGKVLNQTADIDSDGDGYSNMEELEAGTLPGFADNYPGTNEKGFWEENEGYIILGVLIASIFVLYFVFNRESKKERI